MSQVGRNWEMTHLLIQPVITRPNSAQTIHFSPLFDSKELNTKKKKTLFVKLEADTYEDHLPPATTIESQ